MINVPRTAEICHEVNRAICEAFGDMSQKPWTEAEDWERKSKIKGVRWRAERLNAPVSAQHDQWCADKRGDGWTYGPVKDAEAKTHPNLVPFDELPPEQRLKDMAFTAIVRGMCA